MRIRSAIINAVSAWLQDRYQGPVSVRNEVAGEVLSPPYAVVRMSSCERFEQGHPIYDATVLIAVFHDADATPAAAAEKQAGDLFAKMDSEDELEQDQEAEFIAFCEARGLAVSHMESAETNFSCADMHWQNVLGVQIIAALI